MYFVGVDVGTGSARAALIATDGTIAAQATRELYTWCYESDARLFEQSSAQIWNAIAQCVRSVVYEAGVRAEDVHGIGFDATCSLVVIDANGAPVSVTPPGLGGDAQRNTILWADHRAEAEADLINATGHKVLDFVGGKMSLEMETPKILWLKRHLPANTFAACQFYDLPDYLTFRATGFPARSTCSLVCKCGYIPPGIAGSTIGWQPDFLTTIGLGELARDDFQALGGVPGRNGLVLTAGMPVGAGLSEAAAAELGLLPHTPVASALIDAYAGWVGTAAAGSLEDPVRRTTLADSCTRAVVIAGTSTCYCVQSVQGVHVTGVWGPYRNAVFPDLWMSEGGQSSTGQLLDYVLETHPAHGALVAEAHALGRSKYALLEDTLNALMEAAQLPRSSPASYALLVRDMHMYPDFYGNRSPLADATLRGIISGLSLDRSRADLARRYILTLEAIALQTRHIVESMNARGHSIDALYLSGGGQAQNRIYAQLLADTCGIRVQLPNAASASVVVGSAVLAHLAADVTTERASQLRSAHAVLTSQVDAESLALKYSERLWQIMARTTKPGHSLFPSFDERLRRLLNTKYEVFLEMIDLQRSWRERTRAACA